MKNHFVFTEVETIERIVSEKVTEAVKNALLSLPSFEEGFSKIFSFDQACDFLGISKSHGYKLTSQNKIPHSKRGKRLYFDREVLEAWMLEKRVKTRDEIAQELSLSMPKKRRGQLY